MRKVVFLVAISLGLAGCDNQPTLKALSANERARLAILDKEGPVAEEHLQRALEDRPFSPELHLNLGVAARIQGRVDDADKNYVNARRYSLPGDIQMRFLTHYNSGEAAQAAKNVERAIEQYELALAYQPDSEIVKTNIELLFASGQGKGEGEEQQEGEGGQGENQDQEQKEDEPKQYQQSQKYQPREFKGELSEADVRKILGEIRQQEQKIRADYNRKEKKERPRGKDW